MPIVKLIWPAEVKRQSALYPPLGLGYIASVLKINNIPYNVLDLTFDPNLSQIKNLSGHGNIYAFSCTTPQYNFTVKIAKIIKEKDPEGVICLGGVHPTIMGSELLKNDIVDIIVIGEGEFTMVDIFNSISNCISLINVKGIYYKDKKGNIIKTEARLPIPDLNILPFPAQEYFPVEDYFKIKGFRELSIITSRGCPNNCIFCQPTIKNIFGSKMRKRAARNVVDEIEMMINKFHLDMIVFSDDTFTYSKEHVRGICQEILDRKIHVLWRCQTRVGIDSDTLQLMKKSGCFLTALGVESGSQIILDNINKKQTINQIKETFEVCKKMGILTHAYLMVGNIGETSDTIEETAILLKEVKPFSANVSITTPYPGTELFRILKLDNNINWSDFVHFLGISSFDSCNMSSEEINVAKRKLEIVCQEKSERTTDIINSVRDGVIIRKIIKLFLKNPKIISRVMRLGYNSFKRSGLLITNPYLGK